MEVISLYMKASHSSKRSASDRNRRSRVWRIWYQHFRVLRESEVLGAQDPEDPRAKVGYLSLPDEI